MFRKIYNKLFNREPTHKKSFLETHKYRIRLSTTHYFLEIKGDEYKCWTTIKTVLDDKKLPNVYNGYEFSSCYEPKKAALQAMSKFCEYIVAWERGEIESEPDLEGKLDEFYIIENL